MKVPQIQFFDDKVAGQFQFLDKVIVARCCATTVSLLVGVQYTDKLLMCSCDAVAGSLHGALLRNACLYMFCVSSWVLWPFCSHFLREGELGS